MKNRLVLPLSFIKQVGVLLGLFFLGSSSVFSKEIAVPKVQHYFSANKTFRFLLVDTAQIHLHWKKPDKMPYRKFSILKKSLENKGFNVVALMNASIYSANFQPAGLHVENGEVFHYLNTHEGYGNFHLQPNGVFFVDEKGRPEIVTTQFYQENYLGGEEYYKLATQSGPMLLIDGKINQQFLPKSRSRYTRNAVCTTQSKKLYFVATYYSSTNLYDFASALKQFGCQQALYLDGNISKLYIAGQDSTFHFSNFVSILSVTN